MKITGFTVEKLEDPFGILSGDRYELYLDIEVDEDDELHLENGLRLKVLYVAEDGEGKIVSYSLLENTTDKYIDLALEAEELEIVAAFCKENLE